MSYTALYDAILENRASERMIKVSTFIFQDSVEECIEDKLLKFITENDLSLTDVYLNSYCKRVNRAKRGFGMWNDYYTRIMARAYRDTIGEWER
jgi:hypothetical protein